MDKKEFVTALEKTLMLDPGTLAMSSRLDEHDFDSMAVLEFQALVDEEFQQQIDPPQIAECKTVEDLCNLVEGLRD